MTTRILLVVCILFFVGGMSATTFGQSDRIPKTSGLHLWMSGQVREFLLDQGPSLTKEVDIVQLINPNLPEHGARKLISENVGFGLLYVGKVKRARSWLMNRQSQRAFELSAIFGDQTIARYALWGPDARYEYLLYIGPSQPNDLVPTSLSFKMDRRFYSLPKELSFRSWTTPLNSIIPVYRGFGWSYTASRRDNSLFVMDWDELRSTGIGLRNSMYHSVGFSYIKGWGSHWRLERRYNGYINFVQYGSSYVYQHTDSPNQEPLELPEYAEEEMAQYWNDEWFGWSVELGLVIPLSKKKKIRGCTDPNACNYKSLATKNDGSCDYGRAAYYDRDGDGYGNFFAQYICGNTLPSGMTTLDGDCNDANSAMYPNAPGTGRGEDSDCNGVIDSDEGGAPPILKVETTSIDLKGGSVFSARSNYEVLFDLTNIGSGIGYDLIVTASLDGDIEGIEIGTEQSISSLQAGQTSQVSVPITTNRNTVDGLVRLKIEVTEPRGFSSEPFTIEILTERFKEPDIQVSDFACSPSQWLPNTPIELDVLVQNMGSGDASDVRVKLELPNNVWCLSNNEVVTFESLPKGEAQKVSYDLIVPRNFQASSIQASLSLTESYGEYGSSWSHTFPFTGIGEQTVVVIAGEREGQGDQVPKANLGNASGQGGEIIFSQTNASHLIKSIAVIPKDGADCNGDIKEAEDLAVYAETSMLGTYTVVDRKFIEETLNEIKLGMTGLTFENGVLEAGCIESAQGYLFVEYGCIQNQETIKAKLIHCESSEIVWTCLGQGSSPKETFDEITNSLMKE